MYFLFFFFERAFVFWFVTINILFFHSVIIKPLQLHWKLIFYSRFCVNTLSLFLESVRAFRRLRGNEKYIMTKMSRCRYRLEQNTCRTRVATRRFPSETAVVTKYSVDVILRTWRTENIIDFVPMISTPVFGINISRKYRISVANTAPEFDKTGAPRTSHEVTVGNSDGKWFRMRTQCLHT